MRSGVGRNAAAADPSAHAAEPGKCVGTHMFGLMFCCLLVFCFWFEKKPQDVTGARWLHAVGGDDAHVHIVFDRSFPMMPFVYFCKCLCAATLAFEGGPCA